ncbi:MAG: helix-turn-helix domain-containing protein [Pseudomonadota bacterium]
MYINVTSPKDIGVLIKARRKAKGLAQSDLAHQVGVSRRWLNQVEAGKAGASIGLILKTLSALGVALQVRADADGIVDVDVMPILGPDIDDIVTSASKGSSDD